MPPSSTWKDRTPACLGERLGGRCPDLDVEEGDEERAEHDQRGGGGEHLVRHDAAKPRALQKRLAVFSWRIFGQSNPRADAAEDRGA